MTARRGVGVQVGPQAIRDLVGHSTSDPGRAVAEPPQGQTRGAGSPTFLLLQQPPFGLLAVWCGNLEDPAAQPPERPRWVLLGQADQRLLRTPDRLGADLVFR